MRACAGKFALLLVAVGSCGDGPGVDITVEIPCCGSYEASVHTLFPGGGRAIVEFADTSAGGTFHGFVEYPDAMPTGNATALFYSRLEGTAVLTDEEAFVVDPARTVRVFLRAEREGP